MKNHLYGIYNVVFMRGSNVYTVCSIGAELLYRSLYICGETPVKEGWKRK